MKICLFGITGIPTGKHNLKDPRLDQADKLVEAQRKIYAQVDLADEKEIATSDAILTNHSAFCDLLLKDLDFIEARQGREPGDAEKAVLQKMAEGLVSEKPVSAMGLTAAEVGAISAHNFLTSRPVIVAEEADLAAPEALLLRAFRQAGGICFLTVGGKENRAWPIRAGTTAWEAAGTIHSDLQKGFIRAEIISFEDFATAGGETQAKRAGKLRLELKNYIVQDYDIVSIRFNK
jgi:hypothetical protein